MNILRYDEPIIKLHNAYLDAVRAHNGKRANSVMRRILKHGMEMEDDALCGHAHICMANIAYFQTGDLAAFLKNLRQAIRFVLRSEDDASLKSIYYLISLDALNNGMYDVAYNYAIIALDLATHIGSDNDIGTLHEMAGFVLLCMGEYELSRKYTQTGVKYIGRDKAHPYYCANMMAGFFNEGIACLASGKIARAEQLLEKATTFAEAHADKIYRENLFQLSWFNAYLSLLENDTRKVKKCFARMKELVGEVPNLADDMQDLCRLGNALAARKKVALLGEFLDILTQKKLQPDAVNAQRMLADLKVTYYRLAGDEKKLYAAYREQDAVYDRLEEERKHTYTYVQELIRIAERLKTEQDAVRSEHEELMRRANTDALTGVYNRHALNTYLETAFERAYTKKESIGVVLIDVDGLKDYNDTYGHAAGDDALISIGKSLLAVAKKEGAYAARYGGDEFVLVFMNKRDEQIRACLESLQAQVSLSLSQGVCNAVPAEKNRIWDYLAGADEALYELKRTYRRSNRIRFTEANA